MKQEMLLKTLKALSEENRLKILQLLRDHNFCVRALSKRLKVSEAAVSQHLQVLRHAKLVTGIKEGYFTHYRINSEALDELSKIIKDFCKQGKKCKRHRSQKEVF